MTRVFIPIFSFLRKKTVRRSMAAAGLAAVVFAGILGFANWRVARCENRVFDTPGQLPEREFGLLLGTTRLVQGKYLNPYFQNRIEAAAALYRAGKIKKIIVSGDNRRHGYNEPVDMRQALLAAGVPDRDILPDYAGFRTLDSVVRARNVFGAAQFTVISQKFHCARAVYLADARGIDALGYAADEVPTRFRLKRHVREPFARLLAWLDVNVLGRQPHFPR